LRNHRDCLPELNPPEIDASSPEAKVKMNPVDVKRYETNKENMVRLASRKGKVEMRATLFTTCKRSEALVNFLTLDALDRLSRTPEYKLCAIKIQKIT